MSTRVILGFLLALLAFSLPPNVSMSECHSSLDELIPNFNYCYEELLTQVSHLSESDLGSFVCLTGKMYLFGA